MNDLPASTPKSPRDKVMLAQEQRVVELGDNHNWVEVSDRVSYIKQTFKRAGKGGRMSKIKAIYIGFNSLVEAHRYARSCRLRCQVRPAFRTGIDYLYEVKIQCDVELVVVTAIASSIDKFFPASFAKSSGIRAEFYNTTIRTTKQQRRSRALFC